MRKLALHILLLTIAYLNKMREIPIYALDVNDDVYDSTIKLFEIVRKWNIEYRCWLEKVEIIRSSQFPTWISNKC